MTLQIVAVANAEPQHDYLIRGWNAFKKSCHRYRFDPVILGYGQKWGGLGSKPKLLKKAIEEGVVNAEYTIFADAFDVAFADNPNEILRRFPEFNVDILWNAERNCFPRGEWAEMHPPAQSSFRFFNSGLSIGKTEAYHRIFTQMKVEEWVDDHQLPSGQWVHKNDQDDLMAKFLFGQCAPEEPKMTLDTCCWLFQNMVMVEPKDILIAGKMVRNLETGRFPLAFHWAGGSKTAGLMEPILEALEL